jgi:hypothetical protein
MGGITRTLTDAQKDAVADAFAIGRDGKNRSKKMSAAAIARAAAAGELPGHPAFDISEPYVRQIGRKRLAERGTLYAVGVDMSNPGKANRANLERLARLGAREVSRLERLQGQGKLDAADIGKLAQAIGKVESVRESLGDNGTSGNGAKSHAPAPTGEAEPDPFLAGLSQDSAPASDPT